MRRLFALFTTTLLIAVSLTPAYASTSELTLSIKQRPNADVAIITLYGDLKPSKSGTEVVIQIDAGAGWQASKFKTKTTKIGTWKIVAVATVLNAKVTYRASAYINEKYIYSPIRTITVSESPAVSSAGIDQFGPGERIHGADISRWQHPNDKPIDFVKMYQAGIRFVMIKASDAREDADLLTIKYLAMDHAAAQAAGIYTGFYHYATLPDVTTSAAIIRSAQRQAQKVLGRVAAIGGYGERDLSYALDLENNCVRVAPNKSCAKYASRASVTLWATTFLKAVKEGTGRTPFIYSYPNFLESAMNRSAELAQYPLWLAHYGIDPADPLGQPGLKNGGCFVHSWTSANCSAQWTMWQYTSCGIADKYGVPGTRLDLNVFRGDPNFFLDLTRGTWIPEVSGSMPTNEPTTLAINKMSASSTDKSVTFKVVVTRPDSSPVVTGSVEVIFDPATMPNPKPTQTLIRAMSGEWTLALKGVPAGTYQAIITYLDVSKTHATSALPVVFTVTQGSSVTAQPSAVPSKPVTSTGCAKQIKN